MRLSITARLALLSVALALGSALAVAGLVWQQTHDSAIYTLRRNTVEQADALAALYKWGGIPAVRRAVGNEGAAHDPSLIGAVFGADGQFKAGVGPATLAVPLAPTSFAIGVLGTGGRWDNGEAGYAIRRAGSDWVVSGRLLDDWQRAQRAVERAIGLALFVALVAGIAAGLLVTRYVTRRLDRIAGAVDAVAAGDMRRRVGASPGGNDAFDRLSRRIDGMLDRIDGLVGELRIVTDAIAHDLRSPLARLRARAEQAQTARDAVQRDAALHGLTVETDLVMRMLSTLLEISRTEAGGRASFTRYSPVELVEELVDLYAPVAEDVGMELTLVTEGAVAEPIAMHRELLSQAIANLIDNAMRYAAEGPRIDVRLARGEAGLRLTVADRGPGIPAHARAEALRRFGRLDDARSQPGAGLGLTLVDSVARLHGGSVELGDNAPGLTATILLPVS